jgi:D-serine dehydratase
VECDRGGLLRNRLMLTAGGSGYFDLAAMALSAGKFTRTPEVVLRSGCYLTHDEGMYAELYEQVLSRMPSLRVRGGGLQPALQVWGQVLSCPEPGRVICGVGRRDVGHETHLPILAAWARPRDTVPRAVPEGCIVSGLNDQHAYIDGPADMPFGVGDLLAFGISHPCTTFDKWRALLTVDDSYRVTGAVRTYF